jgi:hypothetical protein
MEFGVVQMSWVGALFQEIALGRHGVQHPHGRR